MLHVRSLVPGSGVQLVRQLAAAYRMFSLESPALLPALSGLRPIPGEPLPSSAGSQEATIVRRQAHATQHAAPSHKTAIAGQLRVHVRAHSGGTGASHVPWVVVSSCF